MAAMQPVSLIGSSITPTSITSPFGAYGPQASSTSGAASAAPGGSSVGAVGAAGAGALGFLGLMGGSGGGSSSGSSPATAADIYAIQQGAGKGTIGNLSSAVSAASMANKYGGVGGTAGGQALGALGGGLQFIQGIKQGGVMGYGSAAVGGLRAASSVASMAGDTALGSTLGAAAGYIAAPLAVYSAIKNFQKGNYVGNTMSDVSAGAAVGSLFGPEGTVIGAAAGAIVGLASTAFSGAKVDPEQQNWQSYVNATGGANATLAGATKALGNAPPEVSFNLLAGMMDGKTSHNSAVENVFGRMGEGNLLTQMTTQINAAFKSGQAKGDMTPAQLYSKVVQPWMNSKGATITNETGGAQLQAVLTNLIGNWQSGALTSNTPLTTSGSKAIGLESYGG